MLGVLRTQYVSLLLANPHHTFKQPTRHQEELLLVSYLVPFYSCVSETLPTIYYFQVWCWYSTELVSNELSPLKWEQQQTYHTQHYKLVTHSSSVFALSDSRY